jgi:hypothetical protein
MPMPALVSSMPMSSYVLYYSVVIIHNPRVNPLGLQGYPVPMIRGWAYTTPVWAYYCELPLSDYRTVDYQIELFVNYQDTEYWTGK